MMCYNHTMSDLLKHMANRRFNHTEKAIVKAFFSSSKSPNARAIAKRAKIAPSTVYRHHPDVHEIPSDLIRFILARYRRQMRRILRHSKTRISLLYSRMLVFISQNRSTFQNLIKRQYDYVLTEMVELLLPKIARAYNLPKNSRKVLDVYQGEIVAILRRWISQDGKNIDRVLIDVVALTRSIRQRLVKVVKDD